MNIKNLMRRGLLGLACLFCCASISPMSKNAGTANYGKYEICIKTGSDIGDGFEGDVYITIIGDKGKTSELHYFDNDEKNFNFGDLDIFDDSNVDVGNIEKIDLRVEADDEWKCQYIAINKLYFDINKSFNGNTSVETFPVDTTRKLYHYDVGATFDGGSAAFATFTFVKDKDNNVLLKIYNYFICDGQKRTGYLVGTNGEVDHIRFLAERDSFKLSYANINDQQFYANDASPTEKTTFGNKNYYQMIVSPLSYLTFAFKFNVSNDSWFAGTDSTVYLKISGTNGVSNEMCLDTNYYDDFCANDHDTYTVVTKDIGDPLTFSILVDGSDDLLLDNIELNGKKFVFDGKWLNDDDGYFEIRINQGDASDFNVNSGSTFSNMNAVYITIGAVVIIGVTVAIILIVRKKNKITPNEK